VLLHYILTRCADATASNGGGAPVADLLNDVSSEVISFSSLGIIVMLTLLGSMEVSRINALVQSDGI